jgi:hypothetical protein
MDEADNRMETEGKGLFIIRNGQKVAKYEAGKWVRYFRESSSVTHPMALKLKLKSRRSFTSNFPNDPLQKQTKLEGCRKRLPALR